MGGPDEPSMPMLVEQGEEVLNNLLGQGMDGCSGTFLEQYAGSAPSLEDVRHAQAQVSLSSEEQNAWTSQVNGWGGNREGRGLEGGDTGDMVRVYHWKGASLCANF
jgi:hypothetical protein